MARPELVPGEVLDGFRVEEKVHRGGMATLWRVSHLDHPQPMLMKVPRFGDSPDPAAIVSFEMEQMILPRLSGIHVPKFIAAGDFSTPQPYIVMERIPGDTLYRRLPDLPLPYEEAVGIGLKIATALDDLHCQNVVHLDVKPSNIMFRPTGEAVLLDYGLSHHDHLPDLMQEEFRLPFGTAPYMAPEQLLGTRNDPRSDLFALGVLLYFFTTGERPFGESETLSGMRRRLWKDPVPPRRLRPDYPPWLQEIVLHCLEVQPAWRYPSARQLAFDLGNPDQVKMTARAEKLKRDGLATVLRRRFNNELMASRSRPDIASHLAQVPIIAVAINLDDANEALNEALRTEAARIAKAVPGARLACVNILKLARLTVDHALNEEGHNKHVGRLAELKNWARTLGLGDESFTVHVIEAFDPANAIIEFASSNLVDHVLIGARENSFRKTVLGSVSAKVAAEAPCSVTVVRPTRRRAGQDGDGRAVAQPV